MTDQRRRLQEILNEIQTVDTQLAEPLTLNDSINELEETIRTYERLDSE